MEQPVLGQTGQTRMRGGGGGYEVKREILVGGVNPGASTPPLTQYSNIISDWFGWGCTHKS